MEIQTQFIITFLLGMFVGVTVVNYCQKVTISIFAKSISKTLDSEQKEKVRKTFKELLKEKQANTEG